MTQQIIEVEDGQKPTVELEIAWVGQRGPGEDRQQPGEQGCRQRPRYVGRLELFDHAENQPALAHGRWGQLPNDHAEVLAGSIG